MPDPLEIVVSVVAGFVLWIAGVHFFDGVHWVLHKMMGSRWRGLRALASPHVMHHCWLDESLTTRWEYQRRNIWGHIVLEYTTQLVFSALLLLVLPFLAIAVCVALQTLVFAFVLSQRGLDVNHRAIEILDAYRPSFLAFPAYHALHHVYPEAHFSAYSKLIDYVVGGGTYLRGKRVALQGGDTPFGRALAEGLRREGVGEILPLIAPDSNALAETDILGICDLNADRLAYVEAYVQATRHRQLPPEVWAVQEQVCDGLARHYYSDVRVTYRAIAIDAFALSDPTFSQRAARTALFFIRRGFNFVPAIRTPRALFDFHRFRRTEPCLPPQIERVKRRADLVKAA